MARLMVNRRQARKVRWVLLASWVAAAACLLWAWSLLHTYGMNPGDGGILRPFPDRFRAALLVTLMGGLPALGMTLFARRYVVELGVDSGHLRITTLNPWRVAPRIEMVRLSELRGARHFPGRLAKGRSEVHAPWITLRVRDRKLPYILDLQAESLNVHRLAALLPGAIEARVADPGGRS